LAAQESVKMNKPFMKKINLTLSKNEVMRMISLRKQENFEKLLGSIQSL